MNSFKLIILVLTLQATTVDQGAPGHSGPWPVYCATSSNVLFSRANSSFSLTPTSTAAGTCYDSIQTLSGSIVGASCALGTPATLSASLTAACIAGAGTVDIRICNPTVGALTPAAGTYTTVIF